MTNTFENLSVSPTDLPQIQTADFHPIAKGYLGVKLISNGIFFLLTLAGTFSLVFFYEGIESTFIRYVIPLGSCLFWIVNIIVVIKGFGKKRYALREKDIIYTKGLLWSVRTTVPFNRIQHAELRQNPVERLFRLHSLKVFTAGGHSSDLVIPGLPRDTADRLKAFVLKSMLKDENGH